MDIGKVAEKFAENVMDDLRIELKGDENLNETLLETKTKNAVRAVVRARSYPKYYTDQDVLNDLESYYENVHDLALYDYNQVGAEGELSHSENSISRSYKNRVECLDGIVAICSQL